MTTVPPKIADSASVGFQMQFLSAAENPKNKTFTARSEAPLWYGWPGDIQSFAIAVSNIGAARDGEEFTLLTVQTDDTTDTKTVATKNVKLVLKGVFGKPAHD